MNLRDLLEGVPAHGRRIGIVWSLRSLPIQTILWLCEISNTVKLPVKSYLERYSSIKILGKKIRCFGVIAVGIYACYLQSKCIEKQQVLTIFFFFEMWLTADGSVPVHGDNSNSFPLHSLMAIDSTPILSILYYICISGKEGMVSLRRSNHSGCSQSWVITCLH